MLNDALPYFLFLAIAIAIYSFGTKSGEDKHNRTPLIITFLCMVLFAGLRDPIVGTDTRGYVRSFMNFDDELPQGSLSEILQDEPGYALLQLVLRWFSTDSWVLLCGVAATCYFLTLRAIERYSANKGLSLFIYITLGYYTFCFNAARQAIALAIFLTAIPYILERRFVRYAIIVLIAAMFHKSVVIALPLYFLFRMRYSWKSLTLLCLSAIAISSVLPTLLISAIEIEARYKLYAYGHATGGYLLTTFYTILTLLFILMRSKIPSDERDKYDIYLQMLICGSVIYLMVSLMGLYVELTRFAAYFQIASIFLFAHIYNSRVKLVSNGFMYCIYCGCLVFFYIFVTTMASLTPYMFNRSF